MSSPLLLQQCPACLVFVMGGRWPYSCCFVGCYLQDLFNTARSSLIYIYIYIYTRLHGNLFSLRLNKPGFLPNCGCVGTSVWMHHQDSNLLLERKAI